jgi:hypothetical protein
VSRSERKSEGKAARPSEAYRERLQSCRTARSGRRLEEDFAGDGRWVSEPSTGSWLRVPKSVKWFLEPAFAMLTFGRSRLPNEVRAIVDQRKRFRTAALALLVK